MANKKTKKESKKKIEKNTKKSYDTTGILLLCTLIVLAVVVIVLIVKVVQAKKEYNEKRGIGITIPVIEESITPIDVASFSKKANTTTTYKFKITNYKDKYVNNVKLKYNISVNSGVKTKYKLYNINNKVNLLDENNKTKDFTLDKSKKEEIIYVLEITYLEDTADDDIVQILVEGKK
ncbi:MAG: hypothetical protein IKE89_00845 [Bacilli bacterium]|nr:hypothetical protein [Bacilli bacterium]